MPWMLLAHTSRQPALGLFRVVACHGGAVEARVPDNSMASLQNAIKWLCYATTCDICLTADGHVLVAAMDEEGCVNGLRPWEHPRQEILDAGKLDNGEQIPLLETYLDSVMVPHSATRLWLVLTSPPKGIGNRTGERCGAICGTDSASTSLCVAFLQRTG